MQGIGIGISDFKALRIRNNYSGNKLMKRKIENYANINPFLNNSEEDHNNILIKSYLNDNHKFIIIKIYII